MGLTVCVCAGKIGDVRRLKSQNHHRNDETVFLQGPHLFVSEMMRLFSAES